MPPVPSITSSPPQKQQPPPPSPSEASRPMTMKQDSFTANDSVLSTAYDVPSDPAPPPPQHVDESNRAAAHDDEPSDHAPHTSQSPPSSRSYDDPDRQSPQHVSDPDYSVGSRHASEQMAEYLDHVESSDAVHDICSFSDVDLSSPRHGDEENPAHGAVGGSGEEGAYARARKKYYFLPMLIRYHLPIMGCFFVFGMFVVAISLSASIAKDNRQNAKQLQQQQQLGGRGNAGAGGDVVINDAPPVVYENVGSEEKSTIHSPKPPVDAGGYADDNSDETGEGEETLGDPMEETPQPTSATPARPTKAPTSSLASSSGASHASANPHWYTTSHPDYQTILLNSPNDNASDSVQKAHLHARDFCLARSMTLCTYRRYCPDGPSFPPYDDENESGTNRDDRVPSTIFDRNPSEWEQWAPLASSGETHNVGNGWVQVGRIGEGGGRCWIYEDWIGDVGVTDGEVPDVGVGNLRWILCCPVEEGESASASASGNNSGGSNSGSGSANQITGDSGGV